MVATRLSQTKQHHNASCTDAYRCPNWLPEPGTSEYDAAKQTQFIGDVESSTVRFQHLVSRDTEKVFRMNNGKHFLTSFSPKEEREKAGIQMCLEREKNKCVPAHLIIGSGDVFTISQMTNLSGVDLDAVTDGSTARLDGITFKVRVSYLTTQSYRYYLAVNDLEFKDVFVDPSSGGTKERTLFSVHGIQFLMSHQGTLKQFSLPQLLLALVTGLGLFAIGKTVTDMLLLYLLPKRAAYKLFVQDMTPDFSPANEGERIILNQVLKAKKAEVAFLQGKSDAEGPHASMILSSSGPPSSRSATRTTGNDRMSIQGTYVAPS